MFTKDKEREGRSQQPPRGSAPQAPYRRPEKQKMPPEGHRRPAEGQRTGGAAPEKRRPAAPQQPRKNPEGRTAPLSGRPAEPQQRRQPPEGRVKPAAGRPAESQQRRRPPEGGVKPAAGRPAESQQRRRPQEGRRTPPTPEQSSRPRRRPAQKISRPNPTQTGRNYENPQDEVFRPAPEFQPGDQEQIFRPRPEKKTVPGKTGRRTEHTRPVQMKPGFHISNPFQKKKTETREPAQGTSYHRSSPKAKKPILQRLSQVGQEEGFPGDPERQAQKARKRKENRDAGKERLKKLAARLDTPAIVYTQPKPFNRNRLLIQLISVLAVACAFVLGTSLFFKVRTITVSGAETYSPHVIQEASGIHEGDNLLTFGRARASGLITANLPYVKSVRIGIKLPGTVNIDVKEADIAYAIKSGDGDWWLITSEGKVTEQITGGAARGYTQVLGVQLDKPRPGDPAVALEAVPEELKDDGTAPTGETKETEKKEDSRLEPPDTVSGSMRLRAALQILTALEANDIVGDAASVNVENIQKIELWYGQRYQVDLGAAEQLDYKIACMYDAILQMSEYQNGMLDVSFTRKKDQVVYTPFV